MAPLAISSVLPVELQYTIIDYLQLDGHSLARCSAVCAHWRLRSYKHKFANVSLAWGSVLFFLPLVQNEFSASAVVPSVRGIRIYGPPHAFPAWDAHKLSALTEVLSTLSSSGKLAEFALQNLAWAAPHRPALSLGLPDLSTITSLELVQTNFSTRTELVAFLDNFQGLRHLVLEDVDCISYPQPSLHAVPSGSYGLALRCSQDFSLRKRLRWDCSSPESSPVSTQELADLAIYMSGRHYEVEDILPTFGRYLHRLQLATQTIRVYPTITLEISSQLTTHPPDTYPDAVLHNLDLSHTTSLKQLSLGSSKRVLSLLPWVPLILAQVPVSKPPSLTHLQFAFASSRQFHLDRPTLLIISDALSKPQFQDLQTIHFAVFDATGDRELLKIVKQTVCEALGSWWQLESSLGLESTLRRKQSVIEAEADSSLRKNGTWLCCQHLSIEVQSPSTLEDIPLRPLRRQQQQRRLLATPKMKFSSSLKFNAVSDWWEEYISYDSLKRHIYQLEKEQHGGLPYRDLEANEQDNLLGQSSTDAVFEPLLNKDLKKIALFYDVQEKELVYEVTELEELATAHEEAGLDAAERYLDDPDADEDDEDDDESISHSPERRRRISSTRRGLSREATGSTRRPHRLSISSTDTMDNEGMSRSISKLTNMIGDTLRDSFLSTSDPDTIWTSRSDYAYDTRLLFKRKITTLYVSLANLKSYVEINQSGFRKILKKYDKVTYSELKDRYMHQAVEKTYPFTHGAKDRLSTSLQRLVDLYAKCVTSGDRKLAGQQLKLHQRENIAWERDTVWRQMIAQQRRGEVEGEPLSMGGALLTPPGPGLFFISTPLGDIRVTKKMIFKIIAGIIFVLLLNFPVVEGKEANRCFAILMFCTFLWATEAIALFVTSMFVPLLLVVLQVIRNDAGDVMCRRDATKWVFSVMFSPTIMLLIGGFTISSALSKTNIDRVLITKVLSLAGSRPSTVLLAFMGVSCFASMWISNVAAPTLCFTLIRVPPPAHPAKSASQVGIRAVPYYYRKSTSVATLGWQLAIALAANIGGQSSPISSPQNLIALQAMDPPLDWARWFAVSLPVSGISIILIWGILLLSYRPARSPSGDGEIEIKQIRPTREPFTHKQWWVTIVCLVTISLWCVAHEIEDYVGDMGVIAIIPVIAFFSTGVLKKVRSVLSSTFRRRLKLYHSLSHLQDDFDHFMWTIVFLAMGGIALGKGVMSSGLLEVMDVIIRDLVNGLSLYSVVLILSPVVLIISTFISHTIASVLLVPIAKEVGSNLPGNHKNLLIFITGLICSTGMGMPVSGFPNQTAATQEDDLGELYLSNIDFLKNGVPASIVATIVVSTIGYLLMLAVG
ncbi:hypothetical protein DXG01_000757 [Tephrocybe rancida]|nr:hypothetical protein DXG01_000757 [Tephrocybe rancida]